MASGSSSRGRGSGARGSSSRGRGSGARGSSSRGRGSAARGSSSRARATEAPSADDALLAPQLNPTFVAMPAADLVSHLSRFRRTDDFVDAALVFAARERRLTEAEDFARAADERIDRLLDEIQARESKIRRAAETEAELRAKIRKLQLGDAALISSGISGGGLAQQAAGHGREPVPQDFITASDDGVGLDDATGVQTMFAEVGDDNMPRTSPLRRIGAALPAASSMPNELAERAVERVVVDAAVCSSHRVTKARMVDSRDEILNAVAGERKQEPTTKSASEQQPLKKKPKTAAPHLVADPLPDMLIDDDERVVEQVVTNVLSCNEVSEDVLGARVTAGSRKVSEEEAQGEDVAASRHRRSQGEEQAARVTKKPRRPKGTSFYNEVFKALKKKEEILIKREEERLAKEAAAAASKQLHCKCWWSDAPSMPSKSEAVDEDSSDDSQN